MSEIRTVQNEVIEKADSNRMWSWLMEEKKKPDEKLI